MAHKKKLKKVAQLFREAFNEGYSEGWSEGYDVGHGSASELNDENQDQFDRGVQAERSRINSILDMKIQDSLDMNRGTQAIFYRNTKELLNIQIDTSLPLYDEDDF